MSDSYRECARDMDTLVELATDPDLIAWLAARDEEKFLEGARWALRAEGCDYPDRSIQNIRDAQAVEEDA